MRFDHLRRLAPICPVCRTAGRADAPLAVLHVERGDEVEILEGALACSAPTCRFEFPILDRIPILVPNVREVLATQFDALTERDDLSPYALSFIADSAGPGSDFDRQRYQLGAYCHAHWASGERGARGTAGAFGELVDAAIASTGKAPTGVWLDIGCAVGRGIASLAKAGAQLVVGIDLSLPMLRQARRALRTGSIAYDLRRVGVVYQRHTIATVAPAPESIALWCADATNLPLPAAHCDGALALNVLDCVRFPASVLHELARSLKSGGRAAMSSPYDWSPSATSLDAWIGGHTQRGPSAGSSAAEVRRALGPSDPMSLGLSIIDEREVAWPLHVHDRAAMHYLVDLIAVAKR